MLYNRAGLIKSLNITGYVSTKCLSAQRFIFCYHCLHGYEQDFPLRMSFADFTILLI